MAGSYKPKEKGFKASAPQGFQSKSQIRKFKALEASGQMAQGTTEKWMSKTSNPNSLPERSKPKKAKRAAKSSAKRFIADGPIGGGFYR